MNTINFQITGKCNMNCAFCCDTVSYQKESSSKEIKNMIDRLTEIGLEKIHITGGEPFLYEELEEVLRYIKESGLKISLSTNGILLSKKLELLSYLDEIILPLDGTNSEILKEMGRETSQIFDTIQNCYMIKNNYPAVKVKISTVLNRKNIKKLESLTRIVTQLTCDEWEVRQFIPHGRGKRNIQEFLVDDEEFEKVTTILQATELAEKITMIPVSEKIRTECTVTPALYLIRLKDETATFYGKLQELSDFSIKEIMKKSFVYSKQK